jgi:protein-S-isoprenylcysteine O-methyltransferase Ste14
VDSLAARTDAWLAKQRVPLGFLAAVAALLFAQPAWEWWAVGLGVALAGEGLRIWASGHLEKGREVTRSGPYRWMRHPLYVGSAVIAVGVAIASLHVVVVVAIGLYMALTIRAAVRTEEAFLHRAFGGTYEDYRQSRTQPMTRRFSLDRARRNREYRAVAGLGLGFGLLALKVLLLL